MKKRLQVIINDRYMRTEFLGNSAIFIGLVICFTLLFIQFLHIIHEI